MHQHRNAPSEQIPWNPLQVFDSVGGAFKYLQCKLQQAQELPKKAAPTHIDVCIKDILINCKNPSLLIQGAAVFV